MDVEKHLLSLPVVSQKSGPQTSCPKLPRLGIPGHMGTSLWCLLLSVPHASFRLSLSENPGLSLLYQAHLAAKALLPDFHLPGCWDGDEPLWEITSVHMSHIPGPPA